VAERNSSAFSSKTVKGKEKPGLTAEVDFVNRYDAAGAVARPADGAGGGCARGRVLQAGKPNHLPHARHLYERFRIFYISIF